MTAPSPTPPQKALQRVITIAGLDSWSILIVAGLSLLLTLALGNPLGVAISLFILLAGWMEWHGRALLRRRSPDGTRWLVRSQLWLLAVILTYCARSIGSFDATYVEEFVLPLVRQTYQDYLGIDLDQRLQEMQLTSQDLVRMAHQLFVVTYGSVAVVSCVYQGGLALYYRRKAPAIAAAIAEAQAAPRIQT